MKLFGRHKNVAEVAEVFVMRVDREWCIARSAPFTTHHPPMYKKTSATPATS
jgi:hypothetical protein